MNAQVENLIKEIWSLIIKFCYKFVAIFNLHHSEYSNLGNFKQVTFLVDTVLLSKLRRKGRHAQMVDREACHLVTCCHAYLSHKSRSKF